MGIPIPPPLPRLSGHAVDHSHCLNCFKHVECLLTITTNSCPLVSCGLHCGSRYHKCKEEEHKELCPLVLVPCINLLNGCTMSMLRAHKSNHLAACAVVRSSHIPPPLAMKKNIPKPPPLPMNRSDIPKSPSMSGIRSDDGLHRHCAGCVNIGKCVQSPKICPVVSCPLECGARFHICKEDGHQELCPNMQVNCCFHYYGCQKTMLRRERTKHLALCEVNNRFSRSYPQPFPTHGSNIPKPPPPPMIRSSNDEPSSNMNRSEFPHQPLPPMCITTNVPKPLSNLLNTSITTKAPPTSGSRSDGLQKYCPKCFKASVHVQTKSCPVVGCELKCGSRYRSCKEDQHQELCPNHDMLVACPNLNNGCQETMLRAERGNHLATDCEVIKKLAPLSHPSVKPRIPNPPPLPVNNISKMPLHANSSNRPKPSVLPHLLHQHSDGGFLK